MDEADQDRSEMRRDDVLEPDDAGLMLAGEMARDILRE